MPMITDALHSFPVALNFLMFAAFAAGVWFAGARLTYLADELSDRLKLAKSTIGLVFLALATSLPEVATTLTAAIAQNAELVLNNLFGGIGLQTAVLAFADLWVRGAISNYPRKANHALEAVLLVGLLAIMQAAIIVQEPVSILSVGFGSVLVGFAYVGTILLLRHYAALSDWVPIDLPPELESGIIPLLLADDRAQPTNTLLMKSLLTCVAILIFGIGLVLVAETLAVQTGLGSSFVGVTFLAAATSLPELTTTITAVRMGAYTMAISNIFGSNLIMIVLVFPADILYRQGPILRDAGQSTQLALTLGVLVTAIYLVGMIVRRKPTVGRMGIDSMFVVTAYLAGLMLFYLVR